LWNELQSDAWCRTEAKHGLVTGGNCPYRLGQAIEVTIDAVHLRKDQGGFLGGHQPTGNPLEQLGADRIFEATDGHGQVWLRYIQLPCSSTKGARGHNGTENLDLAFLEIGKGHQIKPQRHPVYNTILYLPQAMILD